MNEQDLVHTRIWQEDPEPDNAFATRTARCHGYDVYGEMLGRARWVEMLFLLFRGEAPSPAQAQLLDALAVALANAGPRDPAVHAAMCAGVGGSVAAASLMAALAVGAGQYTGAREVFLAMHDWADCGTDIARWRERLASRPATPIGVWTAPEHAPGFDPHGTCTPTTVKQALETLAAVGAEGSLLWLAAHRDLLEACTGLPLAMTGVAAAVLHALGLDPDEGEMLYLLLRLPGAAAHALEQRRSGHKRFPFFRLDLLNDPADKGAA